MIVKRIIFAFTLIYFFGCNSGSEKASESLPKEDVKKTDTFSVVSNEKGHKIFSDFCISCHNTMSDSLSLDYKINVSDVELDEYLKKGITINGLKGIHPVKFNVLSNQEIKEINYFLKDKTIQ